MTGSTSTRASSTDCSSAGSPPSRRSTTGICRRSSRNRGGWRNRDTATAFADYAEIVGGALGDRVATFTTLNEPWCSAYLGYAAGVHAPGIRNPEAALRAVHHLNLAHGLGLQALRSSVSGAPDYSVTLNLQVVRPASDREEDVDAARQLLALGNEAFLGPMLRGEYPDDLLADTSRVTDWSFVESGDLEQIRQPIDVLGVNYYFTNRVRALDRPLARVPANPFPGVDQVEVLPEPGPHTAMGWNIDPSGLEELLVGLHERFPDLPLMVTENGEALDDVVTKDDAGEAVHDPERIDYLRRHLTAVHRAIERGADVRGYFVWSLMDNFEWAYGYSKRFGIVRVDFFDRSSEGPVFSFSSQ